jgi:SAM-dependent MidA family methyltransferase
VPAVPDGSRDITAAVAMDAVRAAGEDAGAVTLADETQREALHALLPPPDTFAERLAQRELRDPSGLGAFRWLLQRAAPALT